MKDTRRTRLVLAVLLVLGFVLITVDAHGGTGSPLSGLRRVGAAVFGPVERGTAAVTRPVGDFFGRMGGSGDSSTERQLRSQVTALRSQLRTTTYDRNQAAELDGLVHVSSAGHMKLVAAQVIAIGDQQGFSWTVTIGAGSDSGIKPGMTVLNADGLVGRTTTVGPTTSTVLLIGDPDSSVGIRQASSMQLGIAKGDGPDRLTVQLLSGQATLAKGNTLVTFGSQHDLPYVPGIPVGTVIAVKSTPGALTRSAIVRPFADLTALDAVGVVVAPPAHNPGNALVPTKLAPPPSSSKPVSASPKSQRGATPTPGSTTGAGSPGTDAAGGDGTSTGAQGAGAGGSPNSYAGEGAGGSPATGPASQPQRAPALPTAPASPDTGAAPDTGVPPADGRARTAPGTEPTLPGTTAPEGTR